MSKLALVAVLVVSMALVPLLAASTHPKGKQPTRHPDRNNGKDTEGRSLLANLRPQPQDPNSAHALGHTHTSDGDDRAPQGGYVPKRAKNTREQREGKEGNDKPYHSTREQHEGKEGNDKPYHRKDTHRDGGNHPDGYGSEHVVYTSRNQRSRVKPGRNGKPARNGRDGSKGEKDHYGHDDKKSLPAAQGTATAATEPAPVKTEPVATTPVTTQPATSEPVKAGAAPVTPAPAQTTAPTTAATITPAPAQPVGASTPNAARHLLAVNHDDHDHDDDHHDNHFGGGRTELVRHGDHFDRVPVGGSSPWGTELIRHGDHFDRVPVFDTTRANPWDSIGHLIGGIGNSISNGHRWLLASKDEAVVKTPMGSLKAKEPLAAAKSALKSKATLSQTPLGGLKLKNPLAAPKKAVHSAMHKAADNMSKAAHELPKAAANLPKELNKLSKAVGLPRSLLATNTEIIVVNPGHHHHNRRVRCGLLWCWN